jgi:hypothetical protein
MGVRGKGASNSNRGRDTLRPEVEEGTGDGGAQPSSKAAARPGLGTCRTVFPGPFLSDPFSI